MANASQIPIRGAPRRHPGGRQHAYNNKPRPTTQHGGGTWWPTAKKSDDQENEYLRNLGQIDRSVLKRKFGCMCFGGVWLQPRSHRRARARRGEGGHGGTTGGRRRRRGGSEKGAERESKHPVGALVPWPSPVAGARRRVSTGQ